MLKAIFISVPLFLLVTGCSGDEDTPLETAETAETADPGTTMPAPTGDNEWAAPCGDGLPDCPADQTCYMPPLPDGSTTQGYCSPSCSEDAECTDGFFGPGTATCFVPPFCLISCDQAFGEDLCPEGLTCLPTGGPTNACGIFEE
ncbi:MAG: hypothetical protein AAGA48_34865 [Myxococcota bacterium]